MLIFRYLAKEVYTTLTAVTLVLLFIFISNQFVRYLADAAAGKLAMGALLQLMVLQIPHLLGLILPMGLYLGILIAYGRLYMDREMVVLSACGISQLRLLLMTALLAGGIAIPSGILTLWINPLIAAQKDFIIANSGAAAILQTLLPGRFQESNQGRRVYYVESINRSRTEMQNIFIAERAEDQAPESQEWWIINAKSAFLDLNKSKGEKFLVLEDGYRYYGKPGLKDYQMTHFKNYRIRLQDTPSTVQYDEESKSSAELWRTRHDNLKNNAELQWRIAIPISALLLGILALLLSKVNPRRGKYSRLLPAILIYMFYINMLFISQSWIARGELPPGLGMWLNHGVILALILFLLAKHYGWRAMVYKLTEWRRKTP